MGGGGGLDVDLIVPVPKLIDRAMVISILYPISTRDTHISPMACKTG